MTLNSYFSKNLRLRSLGRPGDCHFIGISTAVDLQLRASPKMDKWLIWHR
jgi:hypothetical protein